MLRLDHINNEKYNLLYSTIDILLKHTQGLLSKNTIVRENTVAISSVLNLFATIKATRLQQFWVKVFRFIFGARRRLQYP